LCHLIIIAVSCACCIGCASSANRIKSANANVVSSKTPGNDVQPCLGLFNVWVSNQYRSDVPANAADYWSDVTRCYLIIKGNLNATSADIGQGWITLNAMFIGEDKKGEMWLIKDEIPIRCKGSILMAGTPGDAMYFDITDSSPTSLSLKHRSQYKIDINFKLVPKTHIDRLDAIVIEGDRLLKFLSYESKEQADH